MKTPVIVFVVLSVGLCFGVVLGSSWSTRGSESRITQSLSAPAAGIAPRDFEKLQQDLRANASAIARLERGAAAKIAEDEAELTDAPSEVPPPAQRSPEELQKMWADTVEYHDRQPIDLAFVEQAEPLLSEVLSAGKVPGATITSTECRTKSCMTTVQWNTYADALSNARQFTRLKSEGISCNVGMVMPPPADPDAPYTSNVFFDGCSLTPTGE